MAKGNPSETMKTHFSHPVTHDKVFLMMDACHMLMLARNMLQVHASYCLFALVDSILLSIQFDYVYITLDNVVLYI